MAESSRRQGKRPRKSFLPPYSHENELSDSPAVSKASGILNPPEDSSAPAFNLHLRSQSTTIPGETQERIGEQGNTEALVYEHSINDSDSGQEFTAADITTPVITPRTLPTMSLNPGPKSMPRTHTQR